MIAICGDNTYYAWGRNDKGQLGIGNKKTQFEPFKTSYLFDTKEEFKRIECGRDFSMGLNRDGNVFVWGNQKYLGPKGKDDSTAVDAEEP